MLSGSKQHSRPGPSTGLGTNPSTLLRVCDKTGRGTVLWLSVWRRDSPRRWARSPTYGEHSAPGGTGVRPKAEHPCEFCRHDSGTHRFDGHPRRSVRTARFQTPRSPRFRGPLPWCQEGARLCEFLGRETLADEVNRRAGKAHILVCEGVAHNVIGVHRLTPPPSLAGASDLGMRPGDAHRSLSTPKDEAKRAVHQRFTWSRSRTGPGVSPR